MAQRFEALNQLTHLNRRPHKIRKQRMRQNILGSIQPLFVPTVIDDFRGPRAYSGVIRPVIPITSGHPFRFDPAGDSGINNLRDHPDAEFSLAALAAHERGDQVLIEHVSPLRDLTRHAIGDLDRGATFEELVDFVRQHYRLVLLTADETRHLNRSNRSRMTADRLGEAGIQVSRRSTGLGREKAG